MCIRDSGILHAAFHFLPQDLRSLFGFSLRCFHNQFVVDGQDQAAFHLFVPQPLPYPHHGQLDQDVYKRQTLDNLFSQMAQNDMKELAIVVKADVQGSAEAVKQSLEKISNDEVRVRVIHAGVGAISKSDVDLDVYKRQGW